METSIQNFYKDSSKENLVHLLEDLCKNKVFVPYTIATGKDIHMEVDHLINSHKAAHYPVFSSQKEIPEDYKKEFIWKEESFLDSVSSALEQNIPIVLNAYTQNIVLPKDLLKIIDQAKREKPSV